MDFWSDSVCVIPPISPTLPSLPSPDAGVHTRFERRVYSLFYYCRGLGGRCSVSRSEQALTLFSSNYTSVFIQKYSFSPRFDESFFTPSVTDGQLLAIGYYLSQRAWRWAEFRPGSVHYHFSGVFHSPICKPCLISPPALSLLTNVWWRINAAISADNEVDIKTRAWQLLLINCCNGHDLIIPTSFKKKIKKHFKSGRNLPLSPAILDWCFFYSELLG